MKNEIDENLFIQSSMKYQLYQKELIKWISKLSLKKPEFKDGIDESIISWFLQSAYLFPYVLQLSENSKTLTESLKILIKNGYISQETIEYLKDFVETAPSPNLIWKILEDIHNFHLKKQNLSLPLFKFFDSQQPLILPINKINEILIKLKLPQLPNKKIKNKPIIDDIFKNGYFLFLLYCTLTGENIYPFNSVINNEKALKNTHLILELLYKKNFIDSSFIKSAPLIVSGDIFVFQHLLSIIFFNLSNNDENNNNNTNNNYLEKNILLDGVSLPKIIINIDKTFSKVPYIILNPKNEDEIKWNLRKTIEFLENKKNWNLKEQINLENIFKGEKNTINKLFNGIINLYRYKLNNDVIMFLKNILGL